jgi:hypothetical protein
MMVVQLGRLASYQEAARYERPEGGSSGSGWRVVTEERATGKKARNLRRKKRLHTVRLLKTSSLKEGAM